MPPRNVVPKPRQKPHPPLWVACSRRDTIHLAAQKGIGALAFAFVDPEEAKYWVDDYHTTLGRAGRADRRRGEPEHRVRHDVHVPRGRRRRPRPRHRRRELLRLLARALLRVRPAPPRGRRACGTSSSSAAPSTATTPKRCVAATENQDRLGAKVVQEGVGGLRGAVGTPDQIREYLRALRGVRRRPGDLLLPGRQEPPRAHHGSARAVREGSAARSSRTATRSSRATRSSGSRRSSTR